MSDDPIVAQVRSVREQLAARFDYDVHRIFRDLRMRQTDLGDRLARRSPEADKGGTGPDGQAHKALDSGR